jgi:hypothetical protein
MSAGENFLSAIPKSCNNGPAQGPIGAGYKDV